MKFVTATLGALMLMSADMGFCADLDPRYEVIGDISAEVGGSVHHLVVPFDREADSGFAEQSMIMGASLSINLVGFTVNEQGLPDAPMIQITLLEQQGRMMLLSVEMFDEQGYDAPLVMGGDGGQGALAEHSHDETTSEGTLTGQFMRLTNYASDPSIADGAEPIAASIRWRVTLPPLQN